MEDEEEIVCKLLEERNLSDETISQLLREWSSFGMWLELPEALRVGASFSVDLRLLAPVLLMDGEWEKAQAKLSLDSVDLEHQIAHLSGDFRGAGKAPQRSTMDFKMTGKLSLRVDLAAGLIISISQKCTVYGQGRSADGTDLGLTGKLQSSLNAERISVQAAADARAKKPRFRKSLQASAAHQLSLVLPSHWFLFSEDEATAVWGDSLRPGYSIELLLVDYASADVESFQSQVLVIIAEDHGKQKMKSARSSLGKGWSVEFTYTEKGAERISQLAFFPLRDGWLRVSLDSPRAGFKKLVPTLKAVLKSLKDTRE